jgi:hypothetical protein
MRQTAGLPIMAYVFRCVFLCFPRQMIPKYCSYIHSFRLCTKESSKNINISTDHQSPHLLSRPRLKSCDPSIRNDTTRQPTRTRRTRDVLSLKVNQRTRAAPSQRPTAPKRIQLASTSQTARTLTHSPTWLECHADPPNWIAVASSGRQLHCSDTRRCPSRRNTTACLIWDKPASANISGGRSLETKWWDRQSRI